MFTGLVQGLGRIQASERRGGDVRLRVAVGAMDRAPLAVGDSIAVNGACLTAVAVSEDGFEADVSVETLDRTSLGGLAVGSSVNLEKAVTPATPLGGHMVTGHVDGLGTVEALEQDGRSWRFRFRVPERLSRYIAEKGSICVDGVSLTVNGVEGTCFDVNIVPHTMDATRFGAYRSGDSVNLEVDLVARYLERLLAGDGGSQDMNAGITRDFLARHGFGGE
ncbi:MAG: riboflavin synthase [Ectothiorhodospiraceae bacterium]